jgi:formylglycine-generating enzyme required for sulfatase activity
MIAVVLSCLRLEAGRQAVASATITAGFVSSIAVQDGGEGYQSPPAVVIVGGGGTGATAVAILNGSAVGTIVVTTAGQDYASAPSVVIEAPPATIDAAVLQIDLVPRLTIGGSRGTTNAIEWADSVTAPTQWHFLTNLILGDQPTVLVDSSAPAGAKRFYRVVTTNGEPPGRPPGFAWIPPGRFPMGSPVSELGRNADEIPHWVTLSRGYWMQRTEVTAGQYGAVTKSNPNNQTNPDLPVVVRWSQATNYCAQLTLQERSAGRLPTGYEYRLPTEAEWERAARAGTTSAYYFGDTGSTIGSFEWVNTSAYKRVGQLLPNAWGLYDMLGNVNEWCSDLYGQYPIWEVVNPRGGEGGPTSPHRVSRGAFTSVGLPVLEYRCARRSPYLPESNDVGFRPVLAQGD